LNEKKHSQNQISVSLAYDDTQGRNDTVNRENEGKSFVASVHLRRIPKSPTSNSATANPAQTNPANSSAPIDNGYRPKAERFDASQFKLKPSDQPQ
jgi:hypothetical protein